MAEDVDDVLQGAPRRHHRQLDAQLRAALVEEAPDVAPDRVVDAGLSPP
jgi:hypothetical protein